MDYRPPVEFGISKVACVPVADNFLVGKSFAAHDVAQDIEYLDNHALKIKLSVDQEDLEDKGC